MKYAIHGFLFLMSVGATIALADKFVHSEALSHFTAGDAVLALFAGHFLIHELPLGLIIGAGWFKWRKHNKVCKGEGDDN